MLEIGPADVRLAFLYANGEMNAPEAADFEHRLGEEHALRESLCQAVELMQTLQGLAPPIPRPHYRQRVRERLGTGGKRRYGPRTYRGHPALWCGLGAAVALLTVLALSSVLSPTGQSARIPTQMPAPAAVAEQTEPAPPREESDDDAMLDIAELWASMANGEHLARAHEEEIRRRDRRLLHGDHALHLPGSPSIGH